MLVAPEGGTQRGLLGHGRYLVKNLERVDHAKGQNQVGGVFQKRHRNADEPLPGAGPVYLGRLVQLCRDLLQAADEDHHVKAHLLPHVKDDEEGERVLHVGKPAYIFKAKKGKEFGRGPILDEEVHEKDGNRH